MNLVLEILQELSKSTLYYKGVKVNLLGLPKFDDYSKGSISSTLTQMKNKGLIEKSDKGWNITSVGKNYIKKKLDSFQDFEYEFHKDAPKNLIVMFDIPEAKKPEREWFRWHLKKFKYVMIQKSVWVGPSPLPKEFLNYAASIGLKNCLKTFKLAKSYTFKK